MEVDFFIFLPGSLVFKNSAPLGGKNPRAVQSFSASSGYLGDFSEKSQIFHTFSLSQKKCTCFGIL